jgi:hypothetical protein
VNDKATIVCNDVRDGVEIQDGGDTEVKLPTAKRVFSWPSKFVPSKKDVIVCAMRLTYTDGRGVRISLDASELNGMYGQGLYRDAPDLFYENCMSTVEKATSSK